MSAGHDWSHAAGRAALRHADDCRCAECDSRRYAVELMLDRDRWRQRSGDQCVEIARLERELAEERYARLTMEIRDAVDRGDREEWARLMAERERIDLPAYVRDEIHARYQRRSEP